MRFDYYWRHNCNNASDKFKQTGYEIESRGYLLFFWRSLYPLRHVPKALGAWDMGEPKNVGGGKAKLLEATSLSLAQHKAIGGIFHPPDR